MLTSPRTILSPSIIGKSDIYTHLGIILAPIPTVNFCSVLLHDIARGFLDLYGERIGPGRRHVDSKGTMYGYHAEAQELELWCLRSTVLQLGFFEP